MLRLSVIIILWIILKNMSHLKKTNFFFNILCSSDLLVGIPQTCLAQSARAVEYADCIC